jgi:hypothetical protein
MVQRSPDGVEVASHDELRRFAEASLQALGLTFEELEEQAKQGSFASDRARLTWMAVAILHAGPDPGGAWEGAHSFARGASMAPA